MDQQFKEVRKNQARELLFSTLVKMMTQVVCSVRQSIGVVYKAMSAEIGDRLRIEKDPVKSQSRNLLSKKQVVRK